MTVRRLMFLGGVFVLACVMFATMQAQGGGAAAQGGRRALLARFILEHRLSARDPLSSDPPWERDAIDLVLQDRPLGLTEVAALLA